MRARVPTKSPKLVRLTWKQLLTRFPDRWVVLVDVEWIGDDGDFSTAAVLAEGPGRDETLTRSDPVRAGYREFAHRYTGRIRNRLGAISAALL